MFSCKMNIEMGWARFNPKWKRVWMSCYFCGCGAQDGQKWLEHWDCTFWLFKLYILRKSENVCLMAPVTCDSSAEMHVKHQTSKSVFPLILFTQQDSSCSTIAAEEGEKIQVWTDDRNCFSARSSNLSPLVFCLWSLNHSLCPKNIRPDLWCQCNSNIIIMHCWFKTNDILSKSPKGA